MCSLPRTVVLVAVAVATSSSLFGTALAKFAPPSAPTSSATELPMITEDGGAPLLASSQTLDGSTGLARSVGDTFYLYGGPGSVEGKFQSVEGGPDWQGWTGSDLTEKPVYWQVSTFHAENLNGNGPGNLALWCGQTPEQQPGWASAPGYGNAWDETALYTSEPVADPTVGQTVHLEFYFNFDTEARYDFFHVEYDSAGIWRRVYSVDGWGDPLTTPGRVFTQQQPLPIVYAGNDYGVDGRIRIRFRVTSDYAWSDQDGLWPTDGAVQIDDITLTHRDGTFFEDHEGGAPYLFQPFKSEFFGDFADVYPLLRQDLEPCARNDSPVVGFIDYGQEVRNGPSPDGVSNTGGSTSPNWDYGIPGGFVVNGGSGISNCDCVFVDNAVVSPVIEWELPGGDDDGIDVAGAFLRFSVWSHLPLENAIFYRWQVRSRSTGSWSDWRDRNFVYFGPPQWRNRQLDVSDLLVAGPKQVQVRLRAVSIGSLVYPGPSGDSTPAPVFDNVSFAKYRFGGPRITTRALDLAQDGFPQSGAIAASTPAEREALDVRFDMAGDVYSSPSSIALVAGDSIVVDVQSMIPGAHVTDIRMKWALRKNLFFEDTLRSAPDRSVDQNVSATGPIWTGEVEADTVVTAAGAVVARRYFFDLPDVDFLYPGDQLHFHVQATDDHGRVSTLPANLSGFGVWHATGASAYDRDYTMRALPTLTAEGQPSKLVYNDAFGRGEEDEITLGLAQLGFVEGVHYDIYAVRAPSSGVSNGIGSAGAHGATPEQLAGYDTIVVLFGDLSSFLLNSARAFPYSDKGDDVGTLTGWKHLPGPRHTVYFGDNVVSGQTATTYVQNIMGVALMDDDVRDQLGGLDAARVVPQLTPFTSDFAAYGGCPVQARFDAIVPLPGARVGHTWMDATGAPVPGIAASVVFDRLIDGHRKVDLTYPFSHGSVFPAMQYPHNGRTAFANLLHDTFEYLAVPSTGPVVTAAPSVREASLRAVPNPFNPRTTVHLALVRSDDVRVAVYDVRGELVRILHSGRLEAGEHTIDWNGLDLRGEVVASGVYLARATSSTVELVTKLALVR